MIRYSIRNIIKRSCSSQTKPQLTAGASSFGTAQVEAIAANHPDRLVHAVGDAAYVGEHLRGLDQQITWMSRLKVTSVLHALAPPRTGQSGRPRTKGTRLGTPADLAATAPWRTTGLNR